MSKSDIAINAWNLAELDPNMLRRRKMPVGGWGVASATRLTVADHRVKAIKSNKWFPDVLKGATAAVGGDAILSRADINWETKKGTAVLRLTFGLDASCAVTVIYVHRKMAGKLLTLACRYMGSPEFLPVVRHVVAAKYLVTLDVAMTAAEVGDLNERRLWLATAVALGDEGRLLPQFPMYARPPAGFPPEVVKGLSAIAASSRNPKAVALVKQLLALAPGQKMPNFDVAFSWVFEGERLEQWIQITKPKTAKGRAAKKRRIDYVRKHPKEAFEPKDEAAEKRLKKGRAKGGAATKAPDEMPARWSSGYRLLLHHKSARALALIHEHLKDAEAEGAPVRFTAQWDVDGPFIEFECTGVVVEKPAGTTAPHADYYFVETYDIATGDEYLWYTFPVADFLGLAEGLLSRLTLEDRRDQNGTAWSREDGRYLRDSERFAK
jgi:hypothetical protein